MQKLSSFGRVKKMWPKQSLKADLHGTIFAYDCRMRFL